MLLFRSEEHVAKWNALWKQQPGSFLSPEQLWGLAKAWYRADRRQPDYRRKTADEAQEIFTSLGLTSPFWKL